MIQYLGIIEQRTIEILKMYEMCESKGNYEPLEEIKGLPPKTYSPERIKLDKIDAPLTEAIEEESVIPLNKLKEEAL